MDSTTARILSLGDSYTIGEAVDEAERWPVQLAALLRERGLEVEPPRIIARTGWTTMDLQAAVSEAELAPPYDLVTLLIGVNNQYQRRSLEEYREGFADLLNRAIDFAGSDPRRVLVLSIPDYGVTPFASEMDREAIGSELELFNAANLELTLAAGVAYVDITPTSLRAVEDLSLVAGDGLHPSGEMYRAWAELALHAAETALRSPAQGSSEK
jgi:lysophospholipase L1-like esterase